MTVRRALITGDAGFVGRHFRPYLEERGWSVLGIDVRNGIDARDYFREAETRFDLVVHLAAVVGGRETIEGNPLAVAVDLAIDAEMFQWALRTKQRRVVYYSSSAAYPVDLQERWSMGRMAEGCIDLANVRSPDLTYGWAKLTGEYQAQFVEAEGTRVHVFRPFSGFGPDQDLSYPWPTFVDRARRRVDPFPIWGDGTQVRDFIHVDDVVAATMACVEEDVPGPVNLCSGEGTSFNTLARMATNAAGYSPTFEHLTAKPTGVRYRVGDPTKMRGVYNPSIALEGALKEALA